MNLNNIVQGKKEKFEDLPSLLYKTGDLMKEGYRLSDSIILLLPYYTSNSKHYQQKVEQLLHDGYGAAEIFECLGVKKEFLITIHFGEKHGDLAHSLQLISNQMKHKEAMQKRLIKIISYPLFMFMLLILFFIGFRIYFLPNISNLVLSRSNEGLSTIQWSKFLLHIPDYFIAIGIMIAIIIGSFIIYLYKKDIQYRLQMILKIPFIKTIYQLSITRQLARNLGNLLIAGFTLQESIQHLKKQHYHLDIQFIAKEIEKDLLLGQPLSSIIRMMPYFFQKFELFVEHGENNGLLGRELIVYCDILDEKTAQLSDSAFRLIQPITFLIIAICIISAYLSILLPMYKMIDIV